MTGTKTVAERLREITPDQVYCEADYIEYVLTGERKKCPGGCKGCFRSSIDRLADAIEAEQSERQLSEGIEWPRFEDGELVKFGDKFDHVEGYRNIPVERITFRADGWVDVSQRGGIYQPLRPGERLKRPEPEVLDADGVPIKVGDTVWDISGEKEGVVERVGELNTRYGYRNVAVLWPGYTAPYLEQSDQLTHRKPDTQEAIEDDTTLPPKEYCNRYQLLGADGAYFDDAEAIEAMCKHLIERTRKLMGGE